VTARQEDSGYNGVIKDGETQTNTGEAKMTSKASKANKTAKTSIEGKFFGMIVLAWVALAVIFNLAHSLVPQAKAPAAKTAAAAPTGTHAIRVSALRTPAPPTITQHSCPYR